MIAARCNKCGNIGCSNNNIFCNNYKTIHENDARLFPKVETRTSIIAEFKNKILQLEKYKEEYIKIDDILNLF